MMQSIGLPLLTSQFPMGLAAEELGADLGRPPFWSGPTWPDHLAWGLDSVITAVRLMLCLQPIGASIVARTQLERWSSNLQFNSGIDQQPGESTVAWLNRLWAEPGVRPPDGVETPVGELFADLSELLHGRGRLMPLVWLDVADVTEMPSSEHVQMLEAVGNALIVSLSHIRTCLATAAEQKGYEVLAETINRIRLVAPARSWLPDLRTFLWPLLPMFIRQPGVEGPLGAMATAHRRVISAMQAGREPAEPSELWPAFSFGAHRFRALLAAQHAYQWERKLLGDRFEEQGVENAFTRAVLAGEMAAVVARWLRQDPDKRSPADALAVCASGLRSAQWLWLEDDNRGMGCLRSVIEQVARARTWRLRPERARKTEANPNCTPRDWIEGAGWRRLNLLNRALGEFAHGSTKTNWNVARNALVAIQNTEDVEQAQYTGRTHALTAMIFILSVECAAWADTFGSHLGDAYRRVVRIDDAQADQAIEALLNRAWEKRQTPLR
ncbi:hypothetical protein FF096_14150 [Micromonospora sp. CP22]|nr:hypothetical protein [Micromonospora sp. CP22]